MRVITKAAVAAFMAGRSYNGGNTVVYDDGTHWVLALFGHEIARRSPVGIEVTTAGWNTTTTRERLNGIPGVRCWNAKRELHLNGAPWSGQWTVVVLAGVGSVERRAA